MKLSKELMELAGTTLYQYGKSRKNGSWKAMYCTQQTFDELRKTVDKSGKGDNVELGYDPATQKLDVNNPMVPFLLGQLLGELTKHNIAVTESQGCLRPPTPINTLEF